MLRRWVEQLGEGLERADAGGWALLTAGLMLFAVTALAPTWVELTDARSQRADLADRRRQIEADRHRTERLIQLVREGDPLLLQRLARRELHLQPASMVLGDHVRVVPDPQTRPAPAGRRPESPVRHATLVRWTSGRSRRLLFIASVALMGMGLLSSFRRPRHAAPAGG